MKIIVIDDSDDFQSLLKFFITNQAKDISVVKYDLDRLGKPGRDFNWSEYDLLFLDYQLGITGGDGLTWLREFIRIADFPPVIFITGEGDEYVAVKSIKLGAADYINKSDMSPKKIIELVRNTVSIRGRNISFEDTAKEGQLIMDDISYHRGRLGPVGRKSRKAFSYKFIRLIGEGAMSKVYLAERSDDKSKLVLKVLDLIRLEDKKMGIRFIQEAKLISQINSSFVVKIHGHGMLKKYGYIAMEFFSKGDLKLRMNRPIEPDTVIKYAKDVACALDQIHSIGIVHRDLKPANIMFRKDGSLSLADFGISKRVDNDGDITSLGQIIGTPNYMSPEQCQGYPTDIRTDLYSAGVLIYEMLSGYKPYEAGSLATLVYKHINEDVPKLPLELNRYQEIINCTMAKSPDNRCQTAKELFDIIGSV